MRNPLMDDMIKEEKRMLKEVQEEASHILAGSNLSLEKIFKKVTK